MDPFDEPQDAIQHIRRRPGMYIGNLETGPEFLLFEVIANGVDQWLAGQATHVSISHAGPLITVMDDGPGLPYDEFDASGTRLAETYFTKYHDTPTADGHSPHIHLNRHGLGLIVVNALAETLMVRTHRSGQLWTQSFSQGLPTGAPVSTPSQERGTTISFLPDPGIFEDHTPRWNMVRRKLFETAHLVPGLRLSLGRETFFSDRGLVDLAEFFLPHTSASRFSSPECRHLHLEMEEAIIDAAAVGTAAKCEWHSWCNGSPTIDHGTHVDGFKEALRKLKWKPAVAMIHVIMKEPRFSAPTQDHLRAVNITKIVRKALLKEWGPATDGVN
jgi:DNA gyrase subunit B